MIIFMPIHFAIQLMRIRPIGDVGTIDSYYSANIELLKSDPPLNLYDADWSTVTYQRQLPPALFTCPNVGANVQSSMISGGCVLGKSQVRKSILFSEVSVENYCELDGVLALARLSNWRK